MLTSEQRKAIFMKISELTGDNEEVMNNLADLQKDDTEREQAKPTYTESDVQDKDGVTWQQKYNDMKSKYRERFFSPSEPEKKEEEKPEEKPAEGITFDDLFKKE